MKVTEGELRCNELKKYLERINAPLCVWLSEDGSGIIRKVVYDVASNQLVGLILPIDVMTGMPIASSYVTRSLQDLENFMKKDASSLVYIIMAQPVKENCAPFILQIYGTDNKFTSTDVLNRWNHTKTRLQE